MGEKGREQPFCLWPLVLGRLPALSLANEGFVFIGEEIKPMLGK